MKYNESKYNIVVSFKNEHVLLYNSYSGAFAEIENDVYQLIHTTKIDSKKPCLYFEELAKQGFIKPEKFDEFYKLQVEYKKSVYDTSNNDLTYVIAPTLKCNLNCLYCYEGDLTYKTTMSNEIVEQLVEYIKKHSKENGKIYIVWFGGEPLVAYDKIVKFYDLFLPFAEGKKLDFTAKLITNGIMLDENKVRFLSKQGNIRKIQITLDGTELNYCKLKDATPEQFYKLFFNIKNALKYCKVVIRLNAKSDNFEDLKIVAKQLFDYCEGSPSLSFYIDRIMNYRTDFFDESLYSQNVFNDKRQEFRAFLSTFSDSNTSLPQRRTTYCGLMKTKNLVVGPKGEFYKCEHFLGNETKEIGNVYTGVCYTRELYDFLEASIPSKCKKCKLFPLCLGGCPAERKNIPIKERCVVNIKTLKSQLRDYANDLC